MSAETIYQSFVVWLAIGGAIVIAAAALLITIILLARRIALLAATALDVVGQIEQNTKPIWQLNATNKVARELLDGARAIEGNATAIAGALDADRRHVA